MESLHNLWELVTCHWLQVLHLSEAINSKSTSALTCVFWPMRAWSAKSRARCLKSDTLAARWEKKLLLFTAEDRKRLVYQRVRSIRETLGMTVTSKWTQANLNGSGKRGEERACMAPRSCVMNPAQGSPALDTLPKDKPAGGAEAGKLDMAPCRSFKSKSVELPFSVESLISDRSSPGSSLQSSELGSGCVRTEGSECASPRGVCGSKLEAVGPSETEGTWPHGTYSPHLSELEIFYYYCYFKLKCWL